MASKREAVLPVSRSLPVVLGALCALGFAGQALADSAQPRVVRRHLASSPAKVRTESTARDIPVYEEQSGTGLGLYLGAGGGHLSVTPRDTAAESAKQGPALLGKSTLSFYNDSVAVDLGLGWLNTQISGESRTTIQGNERKTSQASVLTRAGLVEFSPRIKLGRVFEIGPVASVLFGTNSSFNESSDSMTAPVFGGLKAALGFETRNFLIRLSAQGATTLTLTDRRAFLVSGGLEIGIPLIRGKTVVRERETHTIRESFEREIVETETMKEVVREVVLFSFDDQVVHFEFNRAEMADHSREFMTRLGQFLASHPELWSKLRIEGHTDNRGGEEYNLQLSDARARAIVAALASAGVPSERMEARGLGKSNPLDSTGTELAHARNRRVEVSFSEVSDPRRLRDEINRIRFATTTPSVYSRR